VAFKKNDNLHRRENAELADAVRACWSAFFGVALMSGLINLLYLTGSFYMLEIYDRVIPSRSLPTLVGLSILALLLYAFQGVLDFVRSRILVLISAHLDQRLSARAYDIVVNLPLRGRSQNESSAPLRDLEQIRAFMASTGPTALFDLPWMPIYVLICFLFHPWIGIAALVGAVILSSLTIFTEFMTRRPSQEALKYAAQRSGLSDAGTRNAEVLRAMGMAPALGKSWGESNSKYQAAQQRISDVASGLGALSKVLRMLLQSGVLGLGAYLAMQQQATAGIIIASSILVSRALAPVELAIANWKGFVAARQSWRRLSDLLGALQPALPMKLPAPKRDVSVENISAAPPGTQKIVVQDISVMLKAGQGLGVIGPSASGKSSLARVVVGVWNPVRGKVRLDGAALDQWTPAVLGPSIGYLPQDVELFSGTVAQNISRFEESPPPETIIAAARAAGVHDMIVKLADGYDTQIGDSGATLSAGQRQRVALARALYGDPFLVVLDEPNSNLDTEGDKALTRAIVGVRKRGGIVIVIAHRRSALAGVDQVMAMAQGRMQMMGPRDEVLAKLAEKNKKPQQEPSAPALAAPVAASAASLRLVGEGGGPKS